MKPESIKNGVQAFKITAKGMNGGHSGIDIHKGFASANKIINRILFALQHDMLIAEIDGGSLRNAIPRESYAVIVCKDIKKVETIFNQISKEIIKEYASIEQNLKISLEKAIMPENTLSQPVQNKIIQTIYSIHNGVFRMSPDIEGLVETSNNLARVVVNDGNIKILFLTLSLILLLIMQVWNVASWE